jgi:DNA invertase Pin-like site-specific DNA recombinase
VNGTKVGYARCSTDEQDVDIQIEQLAALGVAPERIYMVLLQSRSEGMLNSVLTARSLRPGCAQA